MGSLGAAERDVLPVFIKGGVVRPGSTDVGFCFRRGAASDYAPATYIDGVSTNKQPKYISLTATSVQSTVLVAVAS